MIIENTVTPLVVPASLAEINVTVDALHSLPAGGSFQNTKGNATVSAKKEPDNSLTITAACDSLLLLLEEKSKEVYRFRLENTALKTTLNERKTEIIKEPNGFQWFQIWLGRVLAVIFILIIARLVLLWKVSKPEKS